MNVLVLGAAGRMARAIVKDLVKSEDIEHIVLGDVLKQKMEQLKEEVKSDKITIEVIDVREKENLISAIKRNNVDVVINSLPHEFSVPAIMAEIEAGVNAVDLAFEPPQLELNEMAKDAGVTVIPACGMDPGITNILVGYGYSQLDEVSEIHIIAGGVPQKPYPPLNHKILFRLESLWLEYMEPSIAVRNGQIVQLETLSEVETIEFPRVGVLECAITPTLASMPYTLKGVKEMDAKCPRWPGHYEKIKTFIECGLLDKKPIKVGDCEIVPQKFLTTLLEPIMTPRGEEEKDVTIIQVTVVGKKDEKDCTFQFYVVDWYDEKEKLTSVARTTGFPASIVAQMIGRGEIKEKGCIFPEVAIGANSTLFEKFSKELAKRGIAIQQTIKHPLV